MRLSVTQLTERLSACWRKPRDFGGRDVGSRGKVHRAAGSGQCPPCAAGRGERCVPEGRGVRVRHHVVRGYRRRRGLV